MSSSDESITQGTRITSQVLSEFIAKTIKRYHVPAVAVSVMNADSILLQNIQGTRVFNENRPATLNDYFHIGSCSKSVLAVIAQKLVEDNKITWQTPFFKIYPELKINARDEYLNITLEDLFLCKAGIQPYTSAQETFPATVLESTALAGSTLASTALASATSASTTSASATPENEATTKATNRFNNRIY